MSTVSVVIPTYKHRDFVLQTLDSVFAQTLPACEVIVVNDGSPDDTAAVLKPLAARGRIRYIEQINSGQASARNRGVAEARGKFIALLDDDDLMPPDKLAWQVRALEQAPDLAAIAGIAEYIDSHGRITSVGISSGEITVESLFRANPIMSPGQVMIPTKTLRSIGGFEASIWGADDWQLWFEIAKRGRFLMSDRIGLRYRVHPGNATHQHDRLYRGSQMVLERQLQESPAQLRANRRRIAYRFLYQGWGWRFIKACRQSIRRGQIMIALRELGKSLALLARSHVDIRIALWLGKELLLGRRECAPRQVTLPSASNKSDAS